VPVSGGRIAHEIFHRIAFRIDRSSLLGDNRVLALVKAFFKADILTEDAGLEGSTAGTPQGGILSPLLANVALSMLDDHIAGMLGGPAVAKSFSALMVPARPPPCCSRKLMLFETFRIDQRARDHREIAAAVERRRQLRTNRGFADADAIRRDLATRGITLEDTPDGTRWWRQDE
jgi:hypothetical protein